MLSRVRVGLRRALGHGDRALIAGLVSMVLLGGLAMYFFQAQVTAAVLMVPLLIGSLWLAPRRIPPLVLLILTVLLVETALEVVEHGLYMRRVVNIGVILVMSAVTLVVAYRRERLGVAGLRGDAMLLDLQRRITRQGTVPVLPRGWYVDVAIESAEGTSFAGDFLVADYDQEAQELSLVLVDVSGKGVSAGTRSLLLSGAFGGLLGAVPQDRFLPAANRYLLQQSWAEGFATAVHLHVQLTSGTFEVRSAGHPPVAHFQANTGRWRILDQAGGPALGLVPEASFDVVTGSLGTHDALLLYTDGLVERSRRDISQGIDKLLGHGERLVRSGFEGSANSLVSQLGSGDDDCGLVVVHRS